MEIKISERVRLARKRAGLSQRDIAERLQVSLASVIRYESGARPPGVDFLRGVARECGCDETWLLTGAGSAVIEGPTAAPLGTTLRVTETASTFSVDVDVPRDVADHNRGVIEHMMGQVARIISLGDNRKMWAIKGVLDALDPEKDGGDG